MTQRELTEPHTLVQLSCGLGSGQPAQPRSSTHGLGRQMVQIQTRRRRPPPPTRAKQQGLCAGRKGGRHTARHEACLFSPGIHPLLPHALRSYHPLRITSHTPPEQNPRCSRQTSFTNAPNPSAPSSLGGTAQLPKRLQVSQGTVLVIWKPFNTHTGGEPLLAASDGPAVPSASPASARARLPLFTTAHQI